MSSCTPCPCLFPPSSCDCRVWREQAWHSSPSLRWWPSSQPVPSGPHCFSSCCSTWASAPCLGPCRESSRLSWTTLASWDATGLRWLVRKPNPHSASFYWHNCTAKIKMNISLFSKYQDGRSILDTGSQLHTLFFSGWHFFCWQRCENGELLKVCLLRLFQTDNYFSTF